jgi:bifunctional non-homologous end joining protein LigD
MAPQAQRRAPSQRQYVVQAPPEFVDFQHPKLVHQPPSTDRWLHEIKFDGYRLQVRVASGKVTVWTRNGHDWTAKFPEIVADVAALPDCILDGELCAIDAKGMPSFSKLRAAISPGKTGALVLFVFDLLWHGTDDLRTFSLIDRKARLAKLFESIDSPRLRLVEALPSGGRALLLSACKMGLEGIVSKRRDQPYRSGRGETWVKAKCRPGQEVVIGGWVQEPSRAFKAILVGVYDGDRLRYAGTVKSGFRAAPYLSKRLASLETASNPFALGAPPRKTSEIHWVEPQLVANVEFAEWTDSGKLRQATFKGLRDDRRPTEVRRETEDEEPI